MRINKERRKDEAMISRHVCVMGLLLLGCGESGAPPPPDAGMDVADDVDIEQDVDELPDVANVDVPEPANTTAYEASCSYSEYVDLSGQGAWPYYTNWFAKFSLASLDAPIKSMVKVLMCDPHSQNNDRCPPYWNCDRDEDPDYPGCVWSTHEIKNDGIVVACGQEYFGIVGSDFDFYRYRFDSAIIEVEHD